MKNKEWTNIDKSEPKGAWSTEPDKIQWVDVETGYPCLIVRHTRSWHLCGYVGVPETHPYFEKHYDDVPLEDGVHGGLTFADRCNPQEKESEGICHVVEDGENDKVWWLGFDCAHGGDIRSIPLSRHMCIDFPGDTYKTVDYVRAECVSLAKQLKSLETQQEGGK